MVLLGDEFAQQVTDLGEEGEHGVLLIPHGRVAASDDSDDGGADAVGVQLGGLVAQDAGGDPLALAHQPEQKMLGADVVVAQAAGLVVRELEHLPGAWGVRHVRVFCHLNSSS
jgi:hypothetical protein